MIHEDNVHSAIALERVMYIVHVGYMSFTSNTSNSIPVMYTVHFFQLPARGGIYDYY